MKSMKLGSSAGRTNKPATPTSDAHPDGTSEGDKPRGKPGSEPKQQKSVIPRTRDDSSDEDDPPPTSRPMGPLLEPAPPLLGHSPILPHPFPGHYPPPRHMMPMQGGPEQFYAPHGGRGIVGPAPLPPRSVGGSGGGLLPHQMPPPPMVSRESNPVLLFLKRTSGQLQGLVLSKDEVAVHFCYFWPFFCYGNYVEIWIR